MAGYAIFDNLSLGAEVGEPPKEWRLLQLGGNALIKEGQDYELRLGADDVASAVAEQKKRGKLPLDSRHALFLTARKAGMEEAEALKAVPGGVAALGFGALEERDGDLWLVDVEWLPLAAELFKAGQIRYFSPVVRGLGGGGPFRVTSVALDNVPALSGLDVLAASGEEPEASVKPKKEKKMKKLEAALADLLGHKEVALGAESEGLLVEGVKALGAEIAGLREQAKELAELKPKAAEAQEKLDAMVLGAETAKKEALVDAALAEGRVCKAQKSVLMGMDSVALAEFLAAAPKSGAVPTEGLPQADAGGVVALSAEEARVAQRMGLSEEAMLAEKKRQLGIKDKEVKA